MLGVVVVGELHVEGDGLASLLAQHAGFEVRQHAAFAHHHREAFGGTAGEGFAVELADEVDGGTVALLAGTIDGVPAGALLAQDVDGGFQGLVVDAGAVAVDFQRARVTQLHVGVDLEGGDEFGGVGALALVLGGDLGLAGHPQVLGLHGVAEGTRDGFAEDFGMHLRTVALLDQAHRHLAGAEARHAGGLGHRTQALLDLGGNVGRVYRKRQPAFQGAGCFKLGSHPSLSSVGLVVQEKAGWCG